MWKGDISFRNFGRPSMPKRTDIITIIRSQASALQVKGVNVADPVARTALSLLLKNMLAAERRGTCRSLGGVEQYASEDHGMTLLQEPNLRWNVMMYLNSNPGNCLLKSYNALNHTWMCSPMAQLAQK